MRRIVLQSVLVCAALAQACAFAADPEEFSFAVISHPHKPSSDDAALRNAIESTDAENLAFVVANGIKAVDEACTDTVYGQKKSLLQTAKNGLIVSLAASDWAECKNENGRSVANGKLNRLRDLFFSDEFSLGESRIPVIRQSTTAKFRNFPENARWEIGGIMFATLNLPANNNHFVFDAGRNGEFEDRLVANRDWLQRIFMHAARDELNGIVLFCDGNLLAKPGVSGRKRDGFAEMRRQIGSLAAQFTGKVLVIHGAPAAPTSSRRINWQGKLGELAVGPGWVKLSVNQSAPTLFSVAVEPAQARNNHH